MNKCRVGISLTLIFTSLIFLNCLSSLTHSDNFEKNDLSFSSFPDIIFDYNSTYCIHQTSYHIQLELHEFNCLTLFFTTSGDRTNNEGISIVFTFEEIEVSFVIERLFQDHLGHNLTQFFSYPESFSGEMNVIITIEAQTSFWYEAGSILIFSYLTIEQIEPATITENESSFLVVPSWFRFMGNSFTTERRTATIVFNNSANFNNVNLTLSFLANDFTAYKQYFEIYNNNQLKSTREFSENQLTTESFLLAIDSGINVLTINFVVEICMGEIELSTICLAGKGIDFEDYLPENTYAYYEWEKNEFDHTFDLSPLKPIVSYSEQILEIEIDYGYYSVIAISIDYEVNFGEKTLDSGEINAYGQSTTPLSISVKSPLTHSDDALVLRIQGIAEESGIFYLLQSSHISIDPLQYLQEQEKVVRTLVEADIYSIPPSEILILTFNDFFRVTPDYLHCNFSLSFSLFSEMYVIQQIDVLMKVNLLTVIDTQHLLEDQVTVEGYKTLYSDLYEITLTLTIYCRMSNVTLTDLTYSVVDSINDYSNISNPLDNQEVSDNNPLPFKKSTIMCVEYGSLLLFFCLIFSQGMLKRKEKGRPSEENGERERNASIFKKFIQFPKKWWLKINESFFRSILILTSLCYLGIKADILSQIIDKLAFVERFSFHFSKLHELGDWIFYPFVFCVVASSFVGFSALFLVFTSMYYRDLYNVSKIVGEILLLFYIPSGVGLLLFLASNGFLNAIYEILLMLGSFLLIVVFLRLLEKNEQKQPDKIIKSFFRTNKIESEAQILDQATNSGIENDSSQKQIEKYKYKFLNYIISKITPEIQVLTTRFAEKFQISLDLAHNLLVDINNEHPNIGEYFIEEQIYKRSKIEVDRITLDENPQENFLEFIPKNNNNDVNSKNDLFNYDNMENQDRTVTKINNEEFLLLDTVLSNKYTTEIKTLNNLTILSLEIILQQGFTLEFIRNTLKKIGEGGEVSKIAILKLEIIELIKATCFDNAHWNELIDNKGDIINQDKWEEILLQINRIITDVKCLAPTSNTIPKIIFSTNILQIDAREANNALYENYLKLFSKNVDKEKTTATFMGKQLDLMEAFYLQTYPELTSKQARTYAKYLAAISGYEPSILGLDSTNMGEIFMEAWCKINKGRDSLRRLSHLSSKSKLYIIPNSMQKFKHSFDDFILVDTEEGLEFSVVESKLQNAIYNLNRNLHIKDLNRKILEYVKESYDDEFQKHLVKYLPNNDSELALKIANSLSDRAFFTLKIIGNDFVRKMRSDGTMYSLLKGTLLEKGKSLSYVNSVFKGAINYHKLLALMQNSATLDGSNNIVKDLNLKISIGNRRLIEVPIHSDSFKLCIMDGTISIKGFTSEILDKLIVDKENFDYQKARIIYQNLQSLVDKTLMEINEREITKITSDHEDIIVMKYNEILNSLFGHMIKHFEDFKIFKHSRIQSHAEIAAENINKYTKWLSNIQSIYSVIPYTEIHYWHLPFQKALDNYAIRKNIKLSGSLKKLYTSMLGFNGDTTLLDIANLTEKTEILDKLTDIISNDNKNISIYSLIANALILQKASKPYRLPQGLFNKGLGKRLLVLLDDCGNHINLRNELIEYPITPPTGGHPINSENEMPPFNIYLDIDEIIRDCPYLKKEMLGNFPIKYEKDANRLNIRFLGGKKADGKGANLARQYWKAKLLNIFGSDPNSSSILEKLKENSQVKFNPRIGFDNPIVLMRMYIYLILDYYSQWCEFTDIVIGAIQTMIKNNSWKYLAFPKALRDNNWKLIIEDIKLLKEKKVEISYHMSRNSQRTRTYSEQGKLGLNALGYSKGEWISTHEEALFYFPNSNPYLREITQEAITNIVKILSSKKLTSIHKEWEKEIKLLVENKR